MSNNIHPLVVDANNLCASLSLQKRLYQMRFNHILERKSALALETALKRLERRLEKFEWSSAWAA